MQALAETSFFAGLLGRGDQAMALGHRNQEQQPSFWIAVDELPRSEGHVFYRKLNQLLRAAGFERMSLV